MAETKYLYGAAVQGIQSFIFQTNELRDIVGASELVEQICTKAFEEFGMDGENGEAVVTAAGNIKYIFNKREDCKKAVLEFPKKVMEMAPGITISQAVVKMEGEFTEFKNAVNKLEEKLRAQRNKPMPSMTLGLMAIERNRKTGLPAVKVKDGEFLDQGTSAKKERDENANDRLCEKAFGIKNINHRRFAHDIEKITTKNDWIAIIHADGNGLGKIIQKIGEDNEKLKNFSKNLDEATKNAAQEAFHYIDYHLHALKGNIIPIRPVVLGGDDFTMICRADFAVEYTKAFMKAFEYETEKMGHKLTACAGIAFIKSSFPFYYGYNMAESLCETAKKDAKSIDKDLAPSCLMFHKIQDSFVTDFNAITERELTPQKGISWNFGPYYLNDTEDRWCIEDLMAQVISLDSEEGNAVKSAIREWMSAMHRDDGYAEQLLKRAEAVAGKSAVATLKAATQCTRTIKQKEENLNAYPAYDILSLHSVIYQETK